MDLKTQSQIISCNRITFLNKKYNIHNNLLFEKQLKSNSPNEMIFDQPKFLETRYISKKSCIFESTEPDQGRWEQQFIIPQINCSENKNQTLFDMNTKAKMND